MTVLDRVRRTYCGLHGHDRLLQFEQDRVWLKCVSCGHESPGWTLPDQLAARPVAVASPLRQHGALRPRLVDTRRIA